MFQHEYYQRDMYWVKFKTTKKNMLKFTNALIYTKGKVQCFNYLNSLDEKIKNALFSMEIKPANLNLFIEMTGFIVEEMPIASIRNYKADTNACNQI